MSLVAELLTMPGVLAAGQFSYRGDRYSYQGNLDHETARLASIMCRATNMGAHMEGDMMGAFCSGDCGLLPIRGWTVSGPRYSVCVVANTFCFVDNDAASLNQVLHTMRKELADEPMEMV